MTVTLTAEQEQFVAEQLKSGHYHSAADVIAQSLGMLRSQESFIRTNAAELREKISVRLDQIRRGEVVSRAAMKQLCAKLRSRKPDGR